MKQWLLVLGWLVGFVAEAKVAGLAPSVPWETGCLQAYHVYRPVSLGLVEHEFIGIHWSNDEHPDQFLVFGLPKGESDRIYFKSEVESRSYQSLAFIGETCNGATTVRVLRTAAEMTREFQKPNEDWLYYIGRMAITPLVGKPCGNTAAILGDALKKQLSR